MPVSGHGATIAAVTSPVKIQAPVDILGLRIGVLPSSRPGAVPEPLDDRGEFTPAAELRTRSVARPDQTAHRLAAGNDPDEQFRDPLVDDVPHVAIISDPLSSEPGAGTLPFALTRKVPISNW